MQELLCYKTEFWSGTESYSEVFHPDDSTISYLYATVHVHTTRTLMNDHLRRLNDRFFLVGKPVENVQRTNICKSNMTTITEEGSRA